jgi:hypothetical protein
MGQHLYNILPTQMPIVNPKVFMGILSTLFVVLATVETGRSTPVARTDHRRWEQREMITTSLIDRSGTEVFDTSPSPWWPCALKRTRTNGFEGRFVRRGSREAHPLHLPAHADASGVVARGLSDLEVRRLGPERGKAPWKRLRLATRMTHSGSALLRGACHCIEATAGDYADRQVRIRFQRELETRGPNR